MTTDVEQPPLFCPKCRRASPDDRDLCSRCGEALQPQGYCEVCERYWPMLAYFDCPKHEIALVQSAPKSQPPADFERDQTLVSVAVFNKPHEAEARRIRLEAEGIPTFLDGERMGANTLYGIATGGIRLMVPEAFVADARILLSQTWAAPQHPDDDLEDAWDDLEPEPASSLEGVTMLVGLIPLALVAAVLLVILVRVLINYGLVGG